MLPKIRILLLATVVIFLLAIFSLVVLTKSGLSAGTPLPSPNGYDDFLKAAELLTGDVFNDSTLDSNSLRALVSTNAESLRLVRLGLTRDCSLPTDTAITNFQSISSHRVKLHSVVMLLAQEARLAEMETRHADAAHSYLDVIRFGNETSRGGFINDRFLGISREGIGYTPLSKLIPKLSSDEVRPVVAALEKIDCAGVTWDEIRRNEKRFEGYQLSKRFYPLAWPTKWWVKGREIRYYEMMHTRVAALVRLLTAELAVRCYQSEQGRAPVDMEQLVPKYLQRVPIDPFSDKPVIYRPQGTNWVLYSVGEDRVDDGGKRASPSVSGIVTNRDLFYDSPY